MNRDVPHKGYGILKGSDLWPLFFDTDPRLDREPDPAYVMRASGASDIVEVSVAV